MAPSRRRPDHAARVATLARTMSAGGYGGGSPFASGIPLRHRARQGAKPAGPTGGGGGGTAGQVGRWFDDEFTHDGTLWTRENGGLQGTIPHLSYLPLENSEDVKLNGVGQQRGQTWQRAADSNDLTLTGMVTPGSGDLLTVHYMHTVAVDEIVGYVGAAEMWTGLGANWDIVDTVQPGPVLVGDHVFIAGGAVAQDNITVAAATQLALTQGDEFLAELFDWEGGNEETVALTYATAVGVAYRGYALNTWAAALSGESATATSPATTDGDVVIAFGIQRGISHTDISPTTPGWTRRAYVGGNTTLLTNRPGVVAAVRENGTGTQCTFVSNIAAPWVLYSVSLIPE